MKKVLFTLILCCSVLFGFSQYYYVPHLNNPGNPGKLNQDPEYPVGGGLDASWTTILGGGQFAPVWSQPQALPFPFMFDGQPVGGFKVSSSGVLTFDVAATAVPAGLNGTLPNPSIPDKSVCVWGLAGTGSNDNVVAKTFGTAPNRQHWVFFSSYNYQGGATACWHYYSIVLEETSNIIYLVDQRHTATGSCAPSLTMGVQIDDSHASQVQGSPFLAPLAASDPTDADNNYFEFIQGVQPKYDMAVNSITTASNLGLGNAPFSISGSIENRGSQTVTSFMLNYRANGGATMSAPITGVSIPAFSSTPFAHPTQWNPGKTGNYEIEVWASEINSFPDQNRGNDTISFNAFVSGRTVDRYPLFEDFTSSTCPPCLPGAQQIEAILGAQSPFDYTLLSYQMSWPGAGDPYFTAEGNTRRNYYGISGIPATLIDGTFQLNPQSLTTSQYTNAKAIPAFLEMQVTHSIDTATKTVTGEVQLNPMVDFPAGLISYIAIVEDTTYNNVENNGQTHFPKVMKKMVPDANGTTLSSLTSGVPYRYTFTYTFQGNYRLPADAGSPIDNTIEHSVEDFSRLQVIVFVQENTTKEVIQSANSSPSCSNSSAFSVFTTATGVNCPSDNTGAMNASSVTGGTSPYNYAWSNGATVQNPMGVAPGTYSVTVTDALGCKTFGSTQVTAALPAMNISAQGALLNCAGDNTGAVTLNVTGGATPYSFAWSSGETTQNLSGKTAGVFSVTITDGNGCTGQAVASVDEPPALVIDNSSSTADNGSNNGTATVTILGGGTPPYFYLWNTSPPQNTAMATGLAAGSYTCTVLDNNGCTIDETVTVESNVGINDLLDAGVSALEVYPNPSTGQFSVNIELAERDNLEVTVVDLNGRVVFQEAAGSVGAYRQEIDLGNVAAGIYMVKVETSKGMGAKRIVIE